MNLLKIKSQIIRPYSRFSNLKKFYKIATVAKQNKDSFQILLDNKSVKTPNGKKLIVNNDLLAHAIAHEWNSQISTVKRHSMHLTQLSNTVIDNPTGRSKETIVNGLIDYMDSDTLCFRTKQPGDLYHMQQINWDPILNYVQRQYNVKPVHTTKLTVPIMPEESRDLIKHYFIDYNDWGLIGYQHCIETLKSVYLSLALLDGYITVDQAVKLSRLETEYQVAKWGNVPWYHEIEHNEMCSRVAAAHLMIYTSNNRKFTIHKDLPHPLTSSN